MEFKVEIKASYAILQPELGHLNEAMASALSQKIDELIGGGHWNFIVDLKQQPEVSVEAGSLLLDLHHRLYEKGHSLVFFNLQDTVLQSMKKEQLHLSLNLSPTLIEAVDIVSMEIVERDILNES